MGRVSDRWTICKRGDSRQPTTLTQQHLTQAVSQRLLESLGS
nr:AC4 [Okra enation leaf curl virus]